MTCSKFAVRRRGFTLIELLIVIVVIAILALIVIPRVMGAGRKAKEATLKGNLHQLRNAIEQFDADTGAYPTALTDIVRAKADPPATGVDESGNSVDIPAGSYQGPYLSPQGGVNNNGIPVNPFKNTEDADFTDETAHWTYADGVVHPTVPASGSTLDKIPYQSL